MSTEEEKKHVEIKIQSTRGAKDFTFNKDTKIASVTADAVQAFGFATGDKFELVLATKPEDPLKPDHTLASYHIKDGTVLVLTAVGGGV